MKPTNLYPMKNDLVARAAQIDEVSSRAMSLFSTAGSFADALGVAIAVRQLREMLSPEVMEPIMALMNTDLGFRTDRDPRLTSKETGKPFEPYSADVVRDCFIEARLRGFQPVGNEWNIIAGRFYAAKNGFRRKVITWPGVTDFKDDYEVPRLVADKGAIVKCRATWKKDGVADSLEREIAVKVNSFMGSDAVLGKAERKLLKAVHDRLTGRNTPDAEVGEEPPIEVAASAKTPPAPEGIFTKVAATPNGSTAAPLPHPAESNEPQPPFALNGEKKGGAR